MDTAVPPVPNDSKLRLQTTVPSDIRNRSGDSSSGSVASTLRGLQNKKLMMLEQESLPAGWAKIKHPELGIYYVHEEKNLVTSSNVLDTRIYSLITEGANILQSSPALQALLGEDQGVGLVLDVQYGNNLTERGPVTTSYYCVSHVERRVFWLEGIGHEEANLPCTSNKCVKSKGSRVHCIEAQYWKHCELFPTTLTVTKDITSELKDILLQAAADRALAKFSTSPYDGQALERMLNVVRGIEADIRAGSAHAAWIVARFMALYNDEVLQSSYGQGDDYFDIEDTGPAIGPYQRHILLAILGPLFFKSPDVFAVELHSFHESFTLARWSNFVHKVDQSIRDSNLLATVLLGTNVGLISWNDYNKTGGINEPSVQQILAYVSITCTIGSIIIGLAISKQYRAKGADMPIRAVVLLKRILKEPFGLESLAIVCSLPFALLMWALIAFLTAFGFIFYRQTGIQVRIPVSLALFFVAVCLAFCLYTARLARLPDKENQKLQRRSTEDTLVPLSKV